MFKLHIIAFDTGGTAVKAALYDESGRECAVASVTMAPLHPAPGYLERDPEAMWAAICLTTRKVLHAAAVAPSSRGGRALARGGTRGRRHRADLAQAMGRQAASADRLA